jgi:hypothetical protein
MSQPASPAPKSAKRRPWPRWLVVTLWTLLGLVLTAGAVTFATVWFGGVHGVEINPYSLARRSYSFYEIPIVRWQVLGIRREDVTSITVVFLEKQKYVAAAKGAPNVWHVVTGTRGRRAPVIGDADVLVRYLEAQDSENYHLWQKWSEENPQLAKCLWPAVSRLAQDELYLFVPDLFDLAKQADDPVAFQAALNKQLAQRLFELGQRLQELEEHAAAKKYLDEAAQLDGESPLIKRAREKSTALAPGGKK